MGNIQKRVDAKNDLTIYTVTGKVSGNEVQDAIREFYEGNITLKVLWDQSKSDVSGITSSDVQKIANLQRKHADLRLGGKTAIAAPEEVAFGLSRMYELLTELRELPFETRALRTREEAYEWLISKD